MERVTWGRVKKGSVPVIKGKTETEYLPSAYDGDVKIIGFFLCLFVCWCVLISNTVVVITDMASLKMTNNLKITLWHTNSFYPQIKKSLY